MTSGDSVKGHQPTRSAGCPHSRPNLDFNPEQSRLSQPLLIASLCYYACCRRRCREGGRIYVTRHQPTTKASVTATAHLTSGVPYHPSTNAHPASEPSCSRVAPTMPRYLSICSAAAQRSNLNAEARSDMRKWAALVNCLPQAGVLKRVKANQPCWNRKERSFNLQLSGLKRWNQWRATICSSHQGQFRAILRTVVIARANWASLAS